MKNLILKTVALTLSVGAILMSTGCSSETELVSISNVESTQYTAYGRYYTNIEIEDNKVIEGIITNDEHIWEYGTDTISEQTPYDNMPVWIAFDDNGTPNDITDDVILGCVYDRETAIYDELETALSDSFELERDGNNIRIQTLKRSDD